MKWATLLNEIKLFRYYASSGTHPGRRGLHEGEALVARGRSPGCTRAKPWLHEGEALVARGRSPGCTRAQPWLHEGQPWLHEGQPWLHEGAALVARGRSPGCTRAQPWFERAAGIKVNKHKPTSFRPGLDPVLNPGFRTLIQMDSG
jgi:hypothetical protein